MYCPPGYTYMYRYVLYVRSAPTHRHKRHRSMPPRTAPCRMVQITLGDEPVEILDDTLTEEQEQQVLQVGDIDKKKQAISFFADLKWKTVGGQQVKGNCMFCKQSVASTGAIRMSLHLSKCKVAPAVVRDGFLALEEKTEGSKKRKTEHKTVIEDDRARQVQEQRNAQKKMLQQGLVTSLKAAEIAVADNAIAKFFYANGISFNVADEASGSYYHEMIQAIKATPSSYHPPGRRKIAGSLLDSCYKRCRVTCGSVIQVEHRRRSLGPPTCLTGGTPSIICLW